jgi:hypothetical protein
MEKTLSNANERITHAAGNDEAWTCICKNTTDAEGFFPCDKNGNEMEPVAGWDDLYVCARCGRIIKQKTLAVVGRNPSPKFIG